MKNVLIISSGTILAQAVVLLFSPLITRLYSAEDFGMFQQYQSILSFLIVIGSLRYETPILIAQELKDAITLTIICFSIGLIIFFGLFITSLGIYYSDLKYFNLKGIRKYILLIPFSFLAATFYQTLSNFVIRKKLFYKLTFAKISQSLGLISGQISGRYFFQVPLGLFIGDLIGKWFSVFTFYHLFKRGIFHLKNLKMKDIKRNLIRFKQYPLISAPGALLNVAGYAVPSLLIGHYFGLKVLGFYALVDRLFAAPSILIGQSVSQVYIAEASKYSIENPKQLKVKFLKLVKYLAIICFLPMLVAAVIAPNIFVFIFGEGWREAGWYVTILAPMQFIGFISWPLTPTLSILEKQGWQFIWELFRVIFTCGTLIIMFKLNFSPKASIGGYSVAIGLCYLTHLALCYKAINQKVLKYNYYEDQ